MDPRPDVGPRGGEGKAEEEMHQAPPAQWCSDGMVCHISASILFGGFSILVRGDSFALCWSLSSTAAQF